MNISQISGVLTDLAEHDLERFSRDEICVNFARFVKSRSTVEKVMLWVALRAPGETQPTDDSKLFGGDSDGQRGPRTLKGLPPYVTGAAFDATQETNCERVRGPVKSSCAELTSAQRGLVFRLRYSSLFCWVVVVGGEEIDAANESDWFSGLTGLLRGVERILSPYDPNTVRGIRSIFYDSLLNFRPSKPAADFSRICRSWQQASGADWTWLWLYNQRYHEFELSSVAMRNRNAELAVPASRTAPGLKSIATYTGKIANPVFVEDARVWSADYDGDVYRVVTVDDLKQLGSLTFDCVPLFKPGLSTRPWDSAIEGVISLHYRNVDQRIRHAPDKLLHMGRVTTLAITRSKTAQQQEILVNLQRMAARYLTRTDRPEIRTEYLNELIIIIKDSIHVGAVSIFYVTPFDRAVSCLATTGLTDRTGRSISSDDLTSVIYRSNEGLTGKCYAGNEIMLTDRMGLDYDEARLVEVSQLSHRGGIDPLLMHPIPREPKPRNKSSPALGVVRCTDHVSPVFSGQTCNFDPTELESLGFITDQIGPVLQTLDQRIERERRISTVKHDVFAPLVMMRDTIDDMLESSATERPFGEYDLYDLKFCNALCINLAGQLDQDPRATTSMTKVRTLLEGDIVARQKHMLHPYAESLKIGIHFEGFNVIPALMINRDLVERAIFNLLVNAIKYSRSKSTVMVSARATQKYFVIDVSNHGIGVEPLEKPHIFKPYYRSPRAEKMAGPGLGLGLSVAKQAMEAHGGDLRLTAPRGPTVFSLYLPRSLAARTRR